MKTRRRACTFATDFYSTQNDAWMRSTIIPDTETRLTQAYFIRKQIESELDSLMHITPMNILSNSWKDPMNGITPLLQLMLTAEDSTDLSSRIGFMNRYGFSAPLILYIQGDPRDHTVCRVFIEEGSPSIGIPEYWSWPEYAQHRRAYRTYVHRLASILGLPTLEQGFLAEREFAQIYPAALERKKRIDMLTWAELNREFTVIDWTAMFTAWGLDAAQLPALKYNVTSKPFMHHIQTRLKNWAPQRWQGWFGLIVAQWVAGCCPHGPLRSAWFAYNRRFLQGMRMDDSPTELRNAAVRALMPNSLGREWVKRFCDERIREQVCRMVETIRSAGIALLRKVSWMAPSTRAAAIRKLRAMEIQVGWPADDDVSVNAAELSSTNLIQNRLALARMSTERNQALLKSGNCSRPLGNRWGRPVFEVNAFYYPDENRFLLPAAILRPPFYDVSASLAWNYGAIGATIGHELCHAFDSDGRRYDERGNQRDWWTARDDREYRVRARAVQKLFETRKYRGLRVQGDLTLVENIADLGGLEFALAGLRAALHHEPTLAELREFFVAFAVSWRSKDRLKRAAELLATDPHAPPMLRVNHVVRQMDEWYLAFGVGDECAEFIRPERRIRFFK